MKSTSPDCRSVSRAARSPVRTSAGPEVMRSPTPISAATMPGERGLPEPGWPDEQQVVHRLATLAGRLDDDLQVLGELRLAHELLEAPWPQPRLFSVLRRVGEGVDRTVDGRIVADLRHLAGKRVADLRHLVVKRVAGPHHLASGAHRRPPTAASSRSAPRSSSSTDPVSGIASSALRISSGP